jgi:hypothetical protein
VFFSPVELQSLSLSPDTTDFCLKFFSMISYELITVEQASEAIEFLINNFFRDEPFGLALGE